MDPQDATRIEALETKVAYLEATLQQLSDVLYRQQQAIDRVIERNRQLLEKPPHY